MADSKSTQIKDPASREDASRAANAVRDSISEIHAQAWALFDLLDAFESEYAADDEQGEQIVRLRQLSGILQSRAGSAKQEALRLVSVVESSPPVALSVSNDTPATADGGQDAEASATLSELESAVRTMDRHSQVAFEEIEALAEVACAALTQADTPKVRTHLRALMDSISYKAQDAMNEINWAAEKVGCNHKEARHG
jgi:hypothetical protein